MHRCETEHFVIELPGEWSERLFDDGAQFMNTNLEHVLVRVTQLDPPLTNEQLAEAVAQIAEASRSGEQAAGGRAQFGPVELLELEGGTRLRQSSFDETIHFTTEFEVLGYPNKIVTVLHNCNSTGNSSDSCRQTVERIRDSITVKGT
jgi:hypothetical protein